MKKRNLKLLKLNKKSISTFEIRKVSGGNPNHSINDRCSLRGGCGTGNQAPSDHPSCQHQ